MHAADITKNLRIGTAVSLAAFYHPLRLAEEVALLDHLSGGRINWGAGRGFDQTEFRAFGVSNDESYEKFRENVEIVLQAWSEDRLSYTGKFNTFNDIEVLPKPLQNPMPFWIASSSQEAIAWSASKGYPILMDPHASHTQIKEKYALYERLLGEHGFENNQITPIARLVAIGRSEDEAEQIARAGAQWMFGSYFGGGRGASEEEVTNRFEDYVANTVIHGTSEFVADKLLELKESIPLEHLMAAPLSHRSFELLTDEVMPRVA